MIHLRLILIILAMANCAMAQDKRDWIWMSNFGLKLDFINKVSGRPQVSTSLYTNTDGGKTRSVICDSATGALLYNSNGAKIYNSAMQVIDNGDNLLDSVLYSQWGGTGFSCNQGDLLLPVGNKVYYFNISISDTEKLFGTGYINRLYYSIIDPSINNGAGKVISKKNILSADSLMGFCGLQALRHANGRDWWLYKSILVRKDHGLTMFRWLISDTGIGARVVITMPSAIGPLVAESIDAGGIQFNQAGTKMIHDNCYNFSMCDVNRCTGELTNKKAIIPASCYKFWAPNGSDTFKIKDGFPSDTIEELVLRGLCFSPNGRFIYVVKAYAIWQWDWQNTDSATAWVAIRQGLDTSALYSTSWTYAKLGPDNRIYIGCNGGQAWQVIDSPDVKGMGCALRLRQINIPQGSFPVWGMGVPPNTPNYKLGIDGSVCWPNSVTEVTVANNEVLVYPNPATSTVTIKHQNTLQPLALLITNSIGQRVFSSKFQYSITIDTQSWPRGIYNVQVGSRMYKLLVE